MLSRVLLVLVTALAGLAGIVTATYFIPVSVMLGPCMKDWTSPNSYSRRASPLASQELHVQGGAIKVCYGRPSARGRTVFGELVPFGRYWRLGANEPTRLFTSVPLEVAGVAIPPGRYSLYALPDRYRWEIAINRSTFHWGTDFSDRVLARDVGRAEVFSQPVPEPVDTLTLTLRHTIGLSQPVLTIEWEQTRVEVQMVVRKAE